MAELIWDGKYEDGKKVAPVRIALPFQTIETVNESVQDRQKSLDMFSSGKIADWKNRLIWGDKKYVLPSLLDEFRNQVKVVYIDPPFNIGADFSYTANVPANDKKQEDVLHTFVKEPSIIEMKAYRDTWGGGLDSYLKWFYETVALISELLRDDGYIFVHLDYRVSHYAKAILDEIFSDKNFRNEIILKRRITKNLQRQFDTIQSLPQGHDVLFCYSKSPESRFKPVLVDLESLKPEGYWHHFWSGADRPTMRYELLGVTPKSGQWKWEKERALRAIQNYKKYLKDAKGSPLAEYWANSGRELEFIRKNEKTGKVENYFPPSDDRIADTIWLDIHTYENEKLYPTQKSEELLERIINWCSVENDLVLDCFVGGG